MLKTCALQLYHDATKKPKRTYNSSLIPTSSTNPHQLWKNVNTLIHHSSLPALPSHDSLSKWRIQGGRGAKAPPRCPTGGAKLFLNCLLVMSWNSFGLLCCKK